MDARFSKNAGLSRGVLVAVIVVIMIVAASGSYFLLFSKSSTSSTAIISTQSTSSSTSSTVSSSASSMVTQSGSQISSSISSSSTNTSEIYAQYNLPFSSANHTVFLFLVPQKSTTSEENYNLTNFGAMKVYVPLGWSINIRIYNNQSTPHSVMIVQNSTDEPTAKDVGTQGRILFIVGNTSDSYLFSGDPGGQQAERTYTNNTVASVFWLVCGVQSHGGAGMWAVLMTSSNITTPHVVITKPVLTPSSV